MPESTGPSESPVWSDLEGHRDGIRKSGFGGRLRYYEWDYTHGHIEVYNSRGEHIGVMDAKSGVLDGSKAVPGRTLSGL